MMIQSIISYVTPTIKPVESSNDTYNKIDEDQMLDLLLAPAPVESINELYMKLNELDFHTLDIMYCNQQYHVVDQTLCKAIQYHYNEFNEVVDITIIPNMERLIESLIHTLCDTTSPHSMDSVNNDTTNMYTRCGITYNKLFLTRYILTYVIQHVATSTTLHVSTLFMNKDILVQLQKSILCSIQQVLLVDGSVQLHNEYIVECLNTLLVLHSSILYDGTRTTELNDTNATIHVLFQLLAQCSTTQSQIPPPSTHKPSLISKLYRMSLNAITRVIPSVGTTYTYNVFNRCIALIIVFTTKQQCMDIAGESDNIQQICSMLVDSRHLAHDIALQLLNILLRHHSLVYHQIVHHSNQLSIIQCLLQQLCQIQTNDVRVNKTQCILDILSILIGTLTPEQLHTTSGIPSPLYQFIQSHTTIQIESIAHITLNDSILLTYMNLLQHNTQSNRYKLLAAESAVSRICNIITYCVTQPSGNISVNSTVFHTLTTVLDSLYHYYDQHQAEYASHMSSAGRIKYKSNMKLSDISDKYVIQCIVTLQCVVQCIDTMLVLNRNHMHVFIRYLLPHKHIYLLLNQYKNLFIHRQHIAYIISLIDCVVHHVSLPGHTAQPLNDVEQNELTTLIQQFNAGTQHTLTGYDCVVPQIYTLPNEFYIRYIWQQIYTTQLIPINHHVITLFDGLIDTHCIAQEKLDDQKLLLQQYYDELLDDHNTVQYHHAVNHFNNNNKLTVHVDEAYNKYGAVQIETYDSSVSG